MPVPSDFFQQAALRLLGGKPIEIAWQDFLLYLRDFLPADYMGLHLVDLGLGIIETVVDAKPDVAELMSKKTTLSLEARSFLEAEIGGEAKEPIYVILNDASQHDFVKQVGIDLGTPDEPAIVMDIVERGHYLGFASVGNSQGQLYSAEHAETLLTLHPLMAETAARFHRYRELERVKDLISDQAAFLGLELQKVVEDEIVGASFGLKRVMDMVERVAQTEAPVLLLGETGVGKEVIAGAIHRSSQRHEGPFIKVNCGSIPPSLLESELFGHEKGAFTGAVASKPGYFERAQGGTIFLDEIGELTPEAQIRLLRVLQDKQVERVGGKKTLTLDIRVLAATHRDLEEMVKDGSFREDLFFRLNVFPIQIPPLRERKEDIPKLAYHFVTKKANDMGLVDMPTVATGAVDALMQYPWPGNVRELENVVEREIILCQGEAITFENTIALASGQACADIDSDELNLDQVVINHITRVMHLTHGKVEGAGGAAELLGVHSRTLQSRMKKLGIPYGRKAKDLYG
jgi:transcriptional regulator with GAF, ATPase, and Fis domain